MTKIPETKQKAGIKYAVISLVVVLLISIATLVAFKHKEGAESDKSAPKTQNLDSSRQNLGIISPESKTKATHNANTGKRISIPYSNLIKLPPVNDIKADKSGKVWIATENGVYKYENNEISKYTLENGKYPFRQAECIEIENNNVLVGSLYGVSCLNHSVKFVDKTKEYELPSSIIWEIKWDGNNLWFATQNGIAFKSIQKPTITLNSQNTNNGLRNNWCTHLLRFSNWLAISHDSGISLWYLNMQAANPTAWRNLDKTKSAISRPIRAMVFDGKKLWIGTPTGLMLLNTNTDKLYSRFSSELISFSELHGLPSNSINTMVFHKDSIWLGTSKGLARIIIHNNQIQTVSPITGEYNETIRKLALQDDILWIGTNKGVQFINTAMVY